MCHTLGFHGGNYEEYNNLGCDAVWHLLEQTFRRNVSPHHQRGKNQGAKTTLTVTSRLKNTAIRSSETLVLTRAIRRYIPEDGILQIQTLSSSWYWVGLCLQFRLLISSSSKYISYCRSTLCTINAASIINTALQRSELSSEVNLQLHRKLKQTCGLRVKFGTWYSHNDLPKQNPRHIDFKPNRAWE
jgi:hypothetical protein